MAKRLYIFQHFVQQDQADNLMSILNVLSALSALFMCVFIVFLLCCCVSAVPRLLRAHGNEIGPHPGLPDHCFEYLPDRQHGHVHLGAREGPAGQTRQGQRLDGGTQRPVAVAAGTTGSPLTPASSQRAEE